MTLPKGNLVLISWLPGIRPKKPSQSDAQVFGHGTTPLASIILCEGRITAPVVRRRMDSICESLRY